MKPLVIIPARGGSKGVPGKNIKNLGGKPLIHYTIEAACQIFPKEVICVSTDCTKITDVVEKTGVKSPFIRPAHLATDTIGTYEVLLHAIKQYEIKDYFPDTVVLLQPTSPFRNGIQISQALELFDNDCEMVMSVKESRSNPYYTLTEEDSDGWLVKSKKGDFNRRQDCPTVYEVNGAIYIIDINTLKQKPLIEFKKVRKYIMDEVSSHDIDTMMDWQIAEFLIDKLTKVND